MCAAKMPAATAQPSAATEMRTTADVTAPAEVATAAEMAAATPHRMRGSTAAAPPSEASAWSSVSSAHQSSGQSNNGTDFEHGHGTLERLPSASHLCARLFF
jgi:hypothetical protein